MCSLCESLMSDSTAHHDFTQLQRTVDELKSQFDQLRDKAAQRRHL